MIQYLYLFLTLSGTKRTALGKGLFFFFVISKLNIYATTTATITSATPSVACQCFLLHIAAQSESFSRPRRHPQSVLSVDCNCIGQGRLSFLEGNPDYLFLRVTQTSSCGRVISADVGVTTWSGTETSVSTGHSVAKKTAITRTLRSWPGHCRLPAKPNGQ